jgi:hypothetical protein
MKFKISVPHLLSQLEAISRIKDLFIKLRHDQKDKISGMKEDWNDKKVEFHFIARGFPVSGTLTVLPSSIDIDAKLPHAAYLFRSKIKQVIREKAKELLSE